MELSIADCDYTNPESVVMAFIRTMNSWEKHADYLSRAGDPTYHAAVLETQGVVFSRFCTPRERKQGRIGSYRRPPQYDPDKEQLLEVTPARGRRVHVETNRDSVLGGGRYRYVLHKNGGRWLIDSVKLEDRGKWRSVVL